jgi:hypothetical protein
MAANDAHSLHKAPAFSGSNIGTVGMTSLSFLHHNSVETSWFLRMISQKVLTKAKSMQI